MADGEATVWAETGVLLRLAIPSSLANMTLGVSFCVVLMISQFGTDAIAGAGLGLMWVNITAQSLFVGSQFGLGALSAQAFGARNHRRVGLLLQRQLLMNWVLCVPIACIWFWTEELLLALGQPPRVSAFAGQFVRWQLPGLPFMPVWMGLMTFLRSQGLVRLPMVVSLVNGALGLLLCYGMTRETALGFAGAPLSTSAIHFAQAATLRYLTPRALAHPTWIQWEREGLHGWCELITIGLGNSIGLWAEWWAGEFQVLLAGLLCSAVADCEEVAVTVLIRNIGMLNFMIVGGFQTGNPIRVGNLLGAGRPEHARFSAIVGGVLQSASGIAVSLLWCSIAPTWAALFGLSSAGTDLLIDLMPYAFGLYVGIAIGCGALRSVLTGMALVKVPSIIQVVSFYPIGLLLGWFLGFRSGYGVIGLWIGVDVGYLVMVLLLFVYMWGSVDWHEQARIAVKRSTPVAAAAHAVSDGDAEDDSADGGDLDGGAGERTRLVADEK